MYSPIIQKLISHFSSLPGIGPKTAERLVFYLLKQPAEKNIDFGQTLLTLPQKIKHCSLCGQISEQEICSYCADSRRDHTVLCIVAESADIGALEKSGQFKGVYFVLGGLVNHLEGVTPDKLNINMLEDRLKSEQIKEIILALNPTIEGETTSLFLTKLLKRHTVKLTKLARGLPQGGDLEYADEVTLANAFKGRTII